MQQQMEERSAKVPQQGTNQAGVCVGGGGGCAE
jgi:hypothetical protein